MIELVAENSVLRLALLLFPFAIVVAAAYLITQAVSARQLGRRRLFETATAGPGAPTLGSLRSERVESAWLKLVNSVERRGLSLVDTEDAALRQKLIAAGYTEHLCAARLHAHPPGAGHCAAGTGAHRILADGRQPEHDPALFPPRHCPPHSDCTFRRCSARKSRPAPARAHQRLPRRPRSHARLRRSRPRPRSGLRARGHGNDHVAPAALGAVRCRRARAEGGAEVMRMRFAGWPTAPGRTTSAHSRPC